MMMIMMMAMMMIMMAHSLSSPLFFIVSINLGICRYDDDYDEKDKDDEE